MIQLNKSFTNIITLWIILLYTITLICLTNKFKNCRRFPFTLNFFFFFGTTTVVGQGQPVPTGEVSFAFFDSLLPYQDSQSYVWGHSWFGVWTHDGHVVKVVRVDNCTTRSAHIKLDQFNCWKNSCFKILVHGFFRLMVSFHLMVSFRWTK